MVTRAFAKALHERPIHCNQDQATKLRQVYLNHLVTAGIPVAPLVPGLTTPPKGSHGFHDANCDLTFLKSTPDANFQIPTGATSGLIALDIDIPAGFDQLRSLIKDDPEWLKLVTHGMAIRSPSGGLHIWLPYDGEELASGPLPNAPQVEVKADRTGLTGPGSVRKKTGKKAPGMYLPLACGPAALARFAQLPVIDGIALEDDPVAEKVNNLNVGIIRQAQARSSSVPVRKYTSKAAAVSPADAQLWLAKQIQEFVELKDGHSDALNKLVWRSLWLASGKLLAVDDIKAKLYEMCPTVKYADNAPRTTPYERDRIDAVIASDARRINATIESDNEKAKKELAWATQSVARMVKAQVAVETAPTNDKNVDDVRARVSTQGMAVR